MKKILFFLIMVQGILLQGTINFKYLSRLDEQSIIRRECEQLQRALLFPGVKEIACSDLDNKIQEYIDDSRGLLNHSRASDRRKCAKLLLEVKLPHDLSSYEIRKAIVEIIQENDESAVEMVQQENDELKYLKSMLSQEVDILLNEIQGNR